MNRFQTKLTESQIFLGVGDQIEPSFLKESKSMLAVISRAGGNS